MKKTIKKQDGTLEEIEGSPEELAEYERRGRPQPPPVKEEVKKPGLLTDELERKLAEPGFMDELRKTLEEIKKQGQQEFPYGPLTQQPLDPLQNERQKFWTYPQHTPSCEITLAQNGWLSINPPQCTCGAAPYRITYPTFTWNVLSDTKGAGGFGWSKDCDAQCGHCGCGGVHVPWTQDPRNYVIHSKLSPCF